VDNALRIGLRGLPGKSSLVHMLAEKRACRYQPWLPRLTYGQILAWADAHHRHIGRWPTATSQAKPMFAKNGAETWMSVDNALRQGRRGLPGGSSLARLLAAKRGVRNIHDLPRLTIDRILVWADAYFARHGTWPTHRSGPIPNAGGETWTGVNAALEGGGRGLPGGWSLWRLLVKRRGARRSRKPRALSVRQIRQWALAYRRRTGRWPTPRSGPIPEAPGQSWLMVNRTLRDGRHRFTRGSALSHLLKDASSA
jgi:hypothetical protein